MNKCTDCQCGPECNCPCCTSKGSTGYAEIKAVSVNGNLIEIKPILVAAR